MQLTTTQSWMEIEILLMAEVFDWRENKAEELTEAKPWMRLRQQWVGQPLCSNVTVRPDARAQGGDGQPRNGRCGKLTVWLWAWGHSKGGGKHVLMALDRLQKAQHTRAMPSPVHQLDGVTSVSCHYSASLALPASVNLSPASLPEQLCRLLEEEAGELSADTWSHAQLESPKNRFQYLHELLGSITVAKFLVSQSINAFKNKIPPKSLGNTNT